MRAYLSVYSGMYSAEHRHTQKKKKKTHKKTIVQKWKFIQRHIFPKLKTKKREREKKS